uniref:Uncharacterized protein n=1 Tax=Romanomermis culicivorax TaxID=13658 RepID=A0A915JZL5_ROMCU
MIARGAGLGMTRRFSVYKSTKPTVSFVGQPPLAAIESKIILSSKVKVEVTSPQNMPGDGPSCPMTEALVNSLEINVKKRARMKAARSLDRATFWSICRASIFGGLLFGLGFSMSILGFYKEFFARVKVALMGGMSENLSDQIQGIISDAVKLRGTVTN